MNLEITFRHMESSPALKAYVEEKMTGFERYLHEPVSMHVVLEVQKKIHHFAEVTIKSKNFEAHCVHDSENMYASIDQMADKLERQLIRHKEKIKEH